MKIIHVVRQFLPSVGGLEDVVYNLAKQQVKEGNRVTVFTLNTNFQTGAKLDNKSIIDGIEVVRFSWKGSTRYPICMIPLNTLIDADIVHIHAVDFFVEYFSLLKRLGKLSAKLVLTTHGGFFHTNNQAKLKRLFFKTITPFSLKQFDVVTCCSINDYELFQPLNKNSYLIENGVNLKKLGALKHTQQKQNDFIYFGRFSENKRLPELIKLFRNLPSGLATLKIIGRSNTGDTKALNSLISELKIENVKLITDIPDEEILEHIQHAKFVISASEYEGFGLSIIELMAYGLVPLLSSEPPSFNRFIKESGCGSSFNLQQDQFTSVIENIVTSWTQQQSELAQVYCKQFSWDGVQEKYANVY